MSKLLWFSRWGLRLHACGREFNSRLKWKFSNLGYLAENCPKIKISSVRWPFSRVSLSPGSALGYTTIFQAIDCLNHVKSCQRIFSRHGVWSFRWIVPKSNWVALLKVGSVILIALYSINSIISYERLDDASSGLNVCWIPKDSSTYS